MSDLQEYIEKRRIRDAEFAEDFEKGYASFKLGILLRQAREAAGLSQEDVAQRLGTPKSTVSKDVRIDIKINQEIAEFIDKSQVKSVVLMEGIIGCPHEEGKDYPKGESCPQCPFWEGRDRWTGELID